jgi:hypothetical protein
VVRVGAEGGHAPGIVWRVGPRPPAAAEAIAQPLVGDSASPKPIGERLGGELGISTRAGKAADVGERFDARPVEQGQEPLERMRRVADGEDLAGAADRPIVAKPPTAAPNLESIR